MAGAIEDDRLTKEYADASSQIDRLRIVASRLDWVLEYAFSIGNPVGESVMKDHPYFQRALGREGSASVVGIEADYQLWQIPDTWNYGHGDYLPGHQVGPRMAPPTHVPANGEPEPATVAAVTGWKSSCLWFMTRTITIWHNFHETNAAIEYPSRDGMPCTVPPGCVACVTWRRGAYRSSWRYDRVAVDARQGEFIMALKLIPAALVAVAALAAASSFAQDTRSSELMEAQSRGYSLSSTNPYSPPMPQMGTPKTHDEVMSELRDAHSRGYSLSSTNPYSPPMPQMGTPKAHDEVTSELRDAHSRGYSLSSTNPYPPRSW